LCFFVIFKKEKKVELSNFPKMSRFQFFNRSNTMHTSSKEQSQKPFNEFLDRSGSLSKFYGSMESMKSSLRGRMVKKLCTLFESPTTTTKELSSSSSNLKPSSEPRAASRLGQKSRSGSEEDEAGMLFRLADADDRIVVYLTSLRGIRRTFEDCNAVKMILKGFRVWVDERDVSMDRAFRKELQVPNLLSSCSFHDMYGNI